MLPSDWELRDRCKLHGNSQREIQGSWVLFSLRGWGVRERLGRLSAKALMVRSERAAFGEGLGLNRLRLALTSSQAHPIRTWCPEIFDGEGVAGGYHRRPPW